MTGFGGAKVRTQKPRGDCFGWIYRTGKKQIAIPKKQTLSQDVWLKVCFLLARSAFSEITSLVKQKAATDQETFAAVMVVMVVMVVTVVVLAIGGVVVTCNLLFLVDFFWLCLIGFIVQIYVFNRFYLDFMFFSFGYELVF